MIYDSRGNLGRYKGIHPNLDIAIAYIETRDLAALPDGCTKISGDSVFVNVTVAHTKPRAQAEFEYHKRYADLHLDLAGKELVAVGLTEPQTKGPYDAAGDGGLCGIEKSIRLPAQNAFVLVFPGEPHAPLLASGTPQTVRKCIFKIRMDEIC